MEGVLDCLADNPAKQREYFTVYLQRRKDCSLQTPPQCTQFWVVSQS